MTQVFPGRYTAKTDEPFVVFLIGMRINKFWAFRKWLPMVKAMGQMISDLYQHPEKGFLGGSSHLSWRSVTLIQYWRSFEELERFARNLADPHVPAWRWVNQHVGDDGSVGFWHETYMISPGQWECVYGNMPRVGLVSVMEHVPATGRRNEARSRLQAHLPEIA